MTAPLPVPQGAAPGRTYEGFHAYMVSLSKLAIPYTGVAAATAALTPAALAAGPACQDEAATLALAQIQVLGHYPDGSIEVFSGSRRQLHRIPSISHFTYAQLLLISGQPARDNIHPGRDAQPGKKTMDEVRNAIAMLAGDVPLMSCTPVGQGIWNNDGHITLINGNQAAVLTAGNKLEEIKAPRVGRQILDFSVSEPWVDFGLLQTYLNEAANPVWCDKALQELIVLMSKWFWKHAIDSVVAASLVAASWVQTLWVWRPEIAITGAAGSGKSMLMDDLLRRLFGKMAAWIAKPSEAAIRQYIGNKSMIILIDEFENDAKRQPVLDLFRSASRGAEIIRGTSDQRGKKFILRHMPWMGNIESGLTEEADRNRFIILNLERPPRGSHGKITLPSDEQLGDLGLRILAATLVNVGKAIAFFQQLKCTHIPDVHGRLVEGFSVPAVMYATLRGGNMSDATAALHSFLSGKNLNKQGIGDEAELMRTILESQFSPGPGRSISVAEVLSNESCFEERRESLERNGVALVNENRGRRGVYPQGPTARIFINPTSVKRYLLRFTDWSTKDISQLLERLPGSEHRQVTIAGKRAYGWLLPATEWITPSEDSDDARIKAMNADLDEVPSEAKKPDASLVRDVDI